MSYQDEVSALSCFLTLSDAAEIAARADAEIAALKRSCEDWESQMRTFRETENAEIAELWRKLASAREDATSALRLVTDIRFALGDDGKRMQPELIEWCKELRRDADRYRWLRRQIQSGPLVIAKCSDWGMESWSGDNPDKEIDAARGGE